ncbi:hypothetical protein F5890DRAFT_887673 [Lentinula detonsa]|uniref:Uncharacterized protein n=1 Tax=Lentinula detonsa TaxID=2804962 RepID=A0AA38Q471_9AGAR|nr:hypothetical protein F5890DRAFT_887673 [Lentinula detonsa]
MKLLWFVYFPQVEEPLGGWNLSPGVSLLLSQFLNLLFLLYSAPAQPTTCAQYFINVLFSQIGFLGGEKFLVDPADRGNSSS